MKFFLSYISDHKKVITTFIIFCAVFAVSFYLYDLPVEAAVYPSLVCAVIGLIFMIYDYVRVREKHKKLVKIADCITETIFSMPEPKTIDDVDYHQIIDGLNRTLTKLQTETSNRYNHMIEYYTVWVHQIKTPIAAIRLTLQNEDTKTARMLMSELFRIEHYVEMVLTYLRLDSLSSDYVFKEHYIDTIIKQSVKKFAAEFIGKKIRLEYEPVNETVITDEKWLSFVIEQILSNALKYTNTGGSVKITMEQPKLLCIKDTGIGIAAEDLPRIFEYGYTGCNGRIDKRASGIGLYLCKKICNNIGIDITVKSTPEKGTAIYLNLEQYQLKKD